MKMKNRFKIINIFLVIVLIILIITGCKNSPQATEPDDLENTEDGSFSVTLTDQIGREVAIEKLPERIVSLAPSNTEILYALGLEEKIVGVTDYCDYPEAAKNKEKIGGFSEPNIEKIVSVKPDLVVATNMHQKSVEELEKLNIPSVVLDPKDFDEMFASIEIIGKATGQQDEALTLIKNLKARMENVEDVVDKVKLDKRPKVYYEIWPSPITTSGPGTFVDDIIQRAGGENIAKDAQKAYPQYSQEMIIDKNPDFIIFSHHGSSNQSIEDVITRQGWENINAIKNKKVFYLDENLVQRATPRLVDGLEKFVEILYPELFK
ncbi:MAG: ABC transporter substrate-binding protein [Tepidanaerobacteraceae bacterium]|jgi:iron complex transport system substrate-binding protein